MFYSWIMDWLSSGLHRSSVWSYKSLTINNVEEERIKVSEQSLKVGTRIRFLKELSQGPTEESPGCLFATKGEEGEVVSVGECWEGYMVKRDSWPAPFGCERKDFEVIEA